MQVGPRCRSAGDVDQSRLDPFTEMMIFLIDVPGSRTHPGNFCQMNGASIVLKQSAKHRWGGFDDWNAERFHFAEKVDHDDSNPMGFGQTDTL